MYRKKISLLLIVSLFAISGCVSKNSNKILSANSGNINMEKKDYNSIYKFVLAKKLDNADDAYIKLKTNYENSPYLNSAADTLAVVHMQNGEYILANFYLQEALEANSGDEFAKFLLVKNQFLAADKNSRDLNYMNRSLKALKVNQNLVYGDYAILANSMLTRVKLEMAWKNSQIGNLYKRLNKENAANIYRQKVEQLGINIEDIVKK